VTEREEKKREEREESVAKEG
jgi:hypothetical protein